MCLNICMILNSDIMIKLILIYYATQKDYDLDWDIGLFFYCEQSRGLKLVAYKSSHKGIRLPWSYLLQLSYKSCIVSRLECRLSIRLHNNSMAFLENVAINAKGFWIFSTYVYKPHFPTDIIINISLKLHNAAK